MVGAEDDGLGEEFRDDEGHGRVTGRAADDGRHDGARRRGDCGRGACDGCCCCGGGGGGGLLRGWGAAAACGDAGGADDAGDGHAGGWWRYCYGGCW